MKEIKYPKALNDLEENQKMMRKLPRSIGDHWSREVDRWLNTEDRQGSVSRPRSHGEPVYPPFSAFCDFLKREARIACNPITSSRTKEEDKKEEPQRRVRFSGNYKNRPVGTSSFASGSSELKSNTSQRKAERKSSESFPLCKSAHNLYDCDKFAKMSQTDRMDVIKSNCLCLGCLKYGHMKKDCRIREVCKSCNGFHPTSIHIDTPRPSEQDSNAGKPQFHTATSATSHRMNALDSKSVSNCGSHSLIVPVWLHHIQDPEKKTLLYALLDDQSDACIVKDDVLQGLCISGRSVQLKLSTVLGEDVVSCQKINGPVVRGFKEESEIPLAGTYSREESLSKRVKFRGQSRYLAGHTWSTLLVS